MPNNVARDLKDAIDGDSSLGLTSGTNLFASQIRAASAQIPKDCVFVIGESGPEPIRSMGQSEEVRIAFTQIVVRWSKFAAGSTTARAIMDSLQGSSISGYLDLVALQSEPTVLGEDSEGLHLWSISYQLVYLDAK